MTSEGSRVNPKKPACKVSEDEKVLRESQIKDALVKDVSSPGAPPRKNGELVFQTPWESRAFGIALALCEEGLYEWEEFRQRLIHQIQKWEGGSNPEESWSYYEQWVASLEHMLKEKGLASAEEISRKVAEVQAVWKHEEVHHNS